MIPALFSFALAASAAMPPPDFEIGPLCPATVLDARTPGSPWTLVTQALPLRFLGPCPLPGAPFEAWVELCAEPGSAGSTLLLILETDGLTPAGLQLAGRDRTTKAWFVLPSSETVGPGQHQVAADLPLGRLRNPATGEVQIRLTFLAVPAGCAERGSSGVSIRSVTLGPPPPGL